jgi:hypothetical protein
MKMELGMANRLASARENCLKRDLASQWASETAKLKDRA